jgi:hypothetical protein
MLPGWFISRSRPGASACSARILVTTAIRLRSSTMPATSRRVQTVVAFDLDGSVGQDARRACDVDLPDREEISRGLAEGSLYKEIGVRVGRGPSVISLEVGGTAAASVRSASVTAHGSSVPVSQRRRWQARSASVTTAHSDLGLGWLWHDRSGGWLRFVSAGFWPPRKWRPSVNQV